MIEIDKVWLDILWCSGFLLLIIITGTLISLYRKRNIFKFAKNVNGFPFIPVIGNDHFIGRLKLFDIIFDLPKKFGLPFGFWSGHHYTYITDDIDEVKLILNSPHSIDKGLIYDPLLWLFGKSLLLVEGPIWKNRRRIFVKSFNPSILRTFVHYFYTNSVVLVESLKKPNYTRPDLYKVFQNYSIDGFCEAIIGKNYNIQNNSKYSIIDDIDRLQDMCRKRWSLELFRFSMLIWGFDGLRSFQYFNSVSKFINMIIKEKKKDLSHNPVTSDTTSKIMDVLLNNGINLTKKQVQKETTLFLSAAADTTGTTMAFTVTLLGMYPEVQQRMYEEVMASVGDKIIEPEDLHNLKYTERVILEAMRILPPIPFVGRSIKEDIQCGSKIFPKGIDVYVNIIYLHRNERYWPDPLKFDPDRFLPDEISKRPKYSYVPFSAGPRNCIGKTYAMMSMKTSLANIVRNLKITSKYKSVNELKFHSFVTMRTLTELDCHFTIRNKE